MKSCQNIECHCVAGFNDKFCRWFREPKKEKQKRIAPMSDKRKEESKEYAFLRKQFLKKHSTCGAMLEGCTKKATDIHHRAGRGQNYLVVATWLQTCRSCHDTIHKFPQFAREVGLLTK